MILNLKKEVFVELWETMFYGALGDTTMKVYSKSLNTDVPFLIEKLNVTGAFDRRSFRYKGYELYDTSYDTGHLYLNGLYMSDEWLFVPESIADLLLAEISICKKEEEDVGKSI